MEGTRALATHTTNYFGTLIAIADDSFVTAGTKPPEKEGNPSVAFRTWQVIAEQPYQLTSDDVIFGVWADRQDIPAAERDAAREQFFSKGQPCLRASDLGKKYGWGIHSDDEGRVALVGVESSAYDALLNDPKVKVVKAMKSKR
jgi:hypothetical protein